MDYKLVQSGNNIIAVAMQFIKHFQILNEIIGSYSCKPITSSSIDCHLTIEIVTQCQIDVSALGLSKSQIAVLNKLMKVKRQENINKSNFQDKPPQQSLFSTQQSYSQLRAPNLSNLETKVRSCGFTIFIIHEYDYSNGHPINGQHPLIKKLMNSIDNIMVLDEKNHIWNNLIHYQFRNAVTTNELHMNSNDFLTRNRPYLVISPNQPKKIKNSDPDSHEYFINQLQAYLQICNIYQGHLNLRVIAYKEAENKCLQNQSTEQKIKYMNNLVQQYRNSQDDLDVLLRNQIPDNAFLKVCDQCGHRITQNFIKQSENFRIISLENSKYYVIRLADCEQKHEQVKEHQLIKPADQLIIWALLDGKPILSLLPLFEGNKIKKKLKLGTNNDKFNEVRSCLGYTKFEMQEKICKKTRRDDQPYQKQKQKQKQISQNQNDSDNDSMECYNSQESILSICSQQIKEEKEGDKSQPCICIINILDKQMPQSQINELIHRQMKGILKKFISERKEIYQNMIIQKNMNMINRISQILKVKEQDIQHVVFLNKL